jgi:hypothetical protein
LFFQTGGEGARVVLLRVGVLECHAPHMACLGGFAKPIRRRLVHRRNVLGPPGAVLAVGSVGVAGMYTGSLRCDFFEDVVADAALVTLPDTVCFGDRLDIAGRQRQRLPHCVSLDRRLDRDDSFHLIDEAVVALTEPPSDFIEGDATLVSSEVSPSIPDYDLLEDDEITADIKVSLADWIHKTVRIGRALAVMQERKRYKKGDDGFVAYLTREFGMGQASAYVYLRAAKFTVTVNILPDAVWALAQDGNSEARSEATARAESGEVITFTTAREIIAAKRAVEQQRKASEKVPGMRRNPAVATAEFLTLVGVLYVPTLASFGASI